MLKKIQIILLGVITITTNVRSQSNFNIELDKIIISDSLNFISSIQDLGVIDESTLILLAPDTKGVYKFDINNSIGEVISRRGRGPFEYISPNIIFMDQNTYWIWDSSLMKLIEFDLEGNGIRELYGINRAISDFYIENNTVVVYIKGITNKEHVATFSIIENKLVNTSMHGTENTDENILLLRKSNLGKVFKYLDYLLYIDPAKLELKYIDDNGMEYKNSIVDKDFIVPKINSNYREIVNNEKEKLLNFLNVSSVFKMVYKIDDLLILELEIGKFEKNNSGGLEIESRKTKYLVYDVKKNIVVSYLYSNDSCLLTNNTRLQVNNKLYIPCYIKNDKEEYNQVIKIFDLTID